MVSSKDFLFHGGCFNSYLSWFGNAVNKGGHCRGGGGVRAEVTSEISLRSARNTQIPFRTRCRLLAWMQASWRACIWRLSYLSW